MNKHTPGPWNIVLGHTIDEIPCYWLIVGSGLIIGDIRSDNVNDGCLLAAAPDLLEALKNLENDDGSIPAHAWNLVQSAIAKAEGSE
jgi:hypothetical protein